MSQPVRESIIEHHLKQRVAEAGGLAFKFKSNVNGVPDQLIVFDGCLVLVEVKRPGGRPRPNQIALHAKIEARGVPVYVVDTIESVDNFCTEVLNIDGVTRGTRPTRARNELAIKSFADLTSGDQ